MYGLTDGKISRYSPSETQKIYEKNITRKQVPEFNPKTTIDIIKNDTSTLSQLDSVGRRDLVVKYLDEVQGTPLTKSSSKSTPGKLPPRKQPTRSKRKKRKIISSDTDEDDDEEEDDDYDFS
uniref:Uncharacterized protein n=1 Tax=Megaselia scalaris TaxID=36166 RepID=T1GJW5_MEGSC